MYREHKNIGEINVSHECSGKNPIRPEAGAPIDVCAGILTEVSFCNMINGEVRS